MRGFVHGGERLAVLKRRAEWFERPARRQPRLALWWTAAAPPDAAEGRRRLERLARDGPGPEAFAFGPAVPAPALHCAET